MERVGTLQKRFNPSYLVLKAGLLNPKRNNKKPTNLKPIQGPNVVRSGSVDYNYYVNETVTCLKSVQYFLIKVITQSLCIPLLVVLCLS